MKKVIFYLLCLITFVLIPACEIEEAEPKPDFAKPASQMFYYSSANIFDKMRLFDKMLFLESYLDMNDTLQQESFIKDYFQYRIEKESVGKYNFVELINNEVRYTIFTDEASIYSIGTEWHILEYPGDSVCKVKYLGGNEWKLNKTETNYYGFNEDIELVFKLNDTIAPLLFQTGNFCVFGNGVLNTAGNYLSSVQISYNIKDSLVYSPISKNILEGNLELEGENKEDHKLISAVGTFLGGDLDEVKYQVLFNNRTKTYQNYLGIWYLW